MSEWHELKKIHRSASRSGALQPPSDYGDWSRHYAQVRAIRAMSECLQLTQPTLSTSRSIMPRSLQIERERMEFTTLSTAGTTAKMCLSVKPINHGFLDGCYLFSFSFQQNRYLTQGNTHWFCGRDTKITERLLFRTESLFGSLYWIIRNDPCGMPERRAYFARANHES